MYNIKWASLCIIIPEGEEKGDWKYLWRNYDWKLSKCKGYWYQDTGSTEDPKQVEPKQAHMKTYWQKIKRILKAAWEKQSINYKGTPIRLSADFSTETLQARREGRDIFKVLKGKKSAG